MSGTEKVFNEAHMAAIKNDFDKCANDIGDAINVLGNLNSHISENYNGQAKPLLSDIVTKLREHLLLLQDCHKNTGKYVEYTSNTAKESDVSWSQSFVQ